MKPEINILGLLFNYYMPYCGRNIIFVSAAYTGTVYFTYDNSA